MKNKLILAIDQGTTSSRAVVFDTGGIARATAQIEIEQHFPKDGWVEHDADQIWASVKATCQQVIEQSRDLGAIAAIGITNQRETTVVWDKRTGQPIHRAIVWQDRRTAPMCQNLRDQGAENTVNKKTGLLLDAYFSGTKIRWILDHVEGAQDLADAGHLAFGTIDSFLMFKLSHGKIHSTDVTNASRTLLFNIHTLQWDSELLTLFGVPAALLPAVHDCDHLYGLAPALFDYDVPIHGVLGDQHAATVGQACLSEGMIKSTYGTGNFVMLNTGPHALVSKNKMLTTIAYRLNGQTHYALEGSVFIAGAVVQWLRDKLHVLEDAKDSERIARSVNDDSKVVMVPAFTGLGAPYWDPDARGAIFGLSRNTGFEHIVTAALESVCFQSRDLLDAMRADGAVIKSIRVDGGMSQNNWVMQHLADILNLPVQRPENIETTVLGAAAVAALGAGIFKSQEDLVSMWALDKEFIPSMDADTREHKLALWDHAVSCVRSN